MMDVRLLFQLTLFIVILLLYSSGIQVDIKEVNLVNEIKSPYTASGAVYVGFNVGFGDTWGYVCYVGDEKNWGKREATTACKQLGYQGGWPTIRDDIDIETSTNNLNNFDCDEKWKDLNKCEPEVIANCSSSLVAGIQCYSSFEANLVDGKIPNVGRVQVKYDSVSSDVCYTQEGSNDWIFFNTQVLCRELGYPGAMFDQKIKAENGIGRSTICGYECRDDLREESLQDCNPSVPNLNQSCGGEVWAACALPGYVGCFDSVNQTISFDSINMTINLCRHYCRNEIYRYALLSGGNTCFCASHISGKPIGDTQCELRCSGDNNEVCGHKGTSSAYDVTKGICYDPLGTCTVYFLGECFTLQCDEGTMPVNNTSVQCVFDKDFKKVTWNSTEFPKCKEKNSTNLLNESDCFDRDLLNESDRGEVVLKIIIGFLSMLLLASWIVFIIAVFWNKIHRIEKNNADTEQEGPTNHKRKKRNRKKYTRVSNREKYGSPNRSSEGTNSIQMSNVNEEWEGPSKHEQSCSDGASRNYSNKQEKDETDGNQPRKDKNNGKGAYRKLEYRESMKDYGLIGSKKVETNIAKFDSPN